MKLNEKLRKQNLELGLDAKKLAVASATMMKVVEVPASSEDEKELQLVLKEYARIVLKHINLEAQFMVDLLENEDK